MQRIYLVLIASLLVFSVSIALAQETSNPLVEFKNQYSGKCLAVKGSSVQHGAALIHINCGTGGPNAVWEIRPEGAGYRIVNKNSGLCLGVRHQSKKDGEWVTQVSPCNRPDTLWKIEYTSPDQPPGVNYEKPIVVRNNHSNKCLALVTGEEIKQYGCPPHRPKTTWQIVEASPFQAAPSGLVAIDDFEEHLLPFHHNGKTYLFGLTPSGRRTSFMTYMPDAIGNAANWWVINDDVKTGFTPVVQRAKMSSSYSFVVPFVLQDHPYIFGLHRGDVKGGVGANIWRINDDTKGFQLVMYKGKISENYCKMVSFQLKGEPYILGLHTSLGANIWHVTQGAKGVTLDLVKYKAKMSPHYKHLKVFYIEGHPYIFGLHYDPDGASGVGANIWRVSDDPSKGLELVQYGAKFPKGYDFISPFHLNGRPYLFAAVSKGQKQGQLPAVVMVEGGSAVESGLGMIIEGLLQSDFCGIFEKEKGYGVIYAIEGDPRSPLIRLVSTKAIPISNAYSNLITFEQGGKAYIFGVHEQHYANIWRVNDQPERGFGLEYYGKQKL